jgi:large subunit ribosomal protein L13
VPRRNRGATKPNKAETEYLSEHIMKTFSAKPHEVVHGWYHVDATDKVLGRLAAEVASRLRGKHKPEYTPHVDTGDFIVVTNVEKLRVTGNKAEDKTYYRHTGYPGGIYETNFNKLQQKHPERVLEKAVKGMLPKGPLGYAMIKKLKIYAGNSHPHAAQQPKELWSVNITMVRVAAKARLHEFSSSLARATLLSMTSQSTSIFLARPAAWSSASR